jgi:ferrochelatase
LTCAEAYTNTAFTLEKEIQSNLLFLFCDFPDCATIHRSCGKAGCSTNLAGSAKQKDLHGKAKHLQLSASGTSSLVHRGPVLKHQRSLAVRSAAAADAYTTFDENVKGVTAHAVEEKEKVGVLLFNLGGPETLNDVQPFLFNLFADPVSDRATCS